MPLSKGLSNPFAMTSKGFLEPFREGFPHAFRDAFVDAFQ